jgi:hypothetical protein
VARLPVEHNLTTPSGPAPSSRRAASRTGGRSLPARSSATAKACARPRGSCASAHPPATQSSAWARRTTALRADGTIVLTYSQAIARAQRVQVEARTPAAPQHYGDGLTLGAVLDYYLDQHLAGKGSEAITRAVVARHVRGPLGAKLVTALDADALRALAQGAGQQAARAARTQPARQAQGQVRGRSSTRVRPRRPRQHPRASKYRQPGVIDRQGRAQLRLAKRPPSQQLADLLDEGRAVPAGRGPRAPHARARRNRATARCGQRRTCATCCPAHS